ncbi:ejaculatory bulb-specific protein 3-like [Schistocerca piceifrons]|uniref:ejaculatory bulb-specific protein 3-like n=1 Tax=Schistocerca piceifrons TaxID=274613 RepID=UPI001F5FE00A|nr:ejaculatory bulb-specific protein 3-like [Schistocerca piceifrons]
MKSALTLLLAVLALAAVSATGGYFKHLHRVKDDGDEKAIKCFLSDEDEPCGEALGELKGKLRGVASTNCGECTTDERASVIEFFRDLFIRNEEAAKQIQNKFDPTGDYRKKYGEAWRKKGVPIY